MVKKIFVLFKIARKLAQSDIIKIISKFHEIPKIIKFFSYLLSISFSNPKKMQNKNINEEDRLCNSIQEMGTTFIKLGQFLSTRPDIIGNEISKNLEKLQSFLLFAGNICFFQAFFHFLLPRAPSISEDQRLGHFIYC